MRVLGATVITIVLTAVPFLDAVQGRLDIDGFGIRFLAAVIFAIVAVAVIDVFIKAATPLAEIEAEPVDDVEHEGRRKTDNDPT